MGQIDGKYTVVSELGRAGAETLYEVRPEGILPDGVTPAPDEAGWRLGWFEAATPAARASFHAYRQALRDLNPAGLADVVTRPGAYYTLWKPLSGVALADFLAQSSRDGETVQNLRALLTRLAAHGYPADAAELLIVNGEPELARLAPVAVTPEEAETRNKALLDRLGAGKLRRRRRRVSFGLFLLSVIPGLGFLVGAGYLGIDAAKVYLNPPIADVPGVAGQLAQTAAQRVTSAGYRVSYLDGENPAQELGTVIGQNPDAGTSLHTGRLVTLTINNPPPLTVPKLEELNLSQVRAALAENRLKLGQLITVQGTGTNTPKGRVIAQLPEPGATAQRGQSVLLMVSGGTAQQQTWLPPLSGLSFEQARDLARKAGLVVNKVLTQDSSAPENTVLAQNPKPYEKVDVGSPVTLTLARLAVSNPTTPVSSLPLPPPPAPVAQPQPQPSAASSDQPTGIQALSDQAASDQGSSDSSAGTSDLTPQNIPALPAGGDSASGDSATAPPEAVRTVQLRYTFPTDLPEGSVDLVVRDQDGEREVVQAQPASALAGSVAQGPVQVRGDATFVVRVNGQDYATFKP